MNRVAVSTALAHTQQYCVRCAVSVSARMMLIYSDPLDVERWFYRAQPALDGERPIDLLGTPRLTDHIRQLLEGTFV